MSPITKTRLIKSTYMFHAAGDKQPSPAREKILAAGALGLGLGDVRDGKNVDVAERNSDDAGQHGEHEHQPELALVFADDYHSNALLRPIDRLPQSIANSILGQRVDEGEPVVSEPTDYNGYVVLIKSTPNALGEYTLVFVNEQTLQQDRWYQFTDDVVFFDTRVSLLSVALTTGGDVEETPTPEQTAVGTSERTTDTTAETTVPADETTTHEVIVETTETSDGE